MHVECLYYLTKSLDPSRPVVGNDGWESVATDIIGIHDYDDEPQQIAVRYGLKEDGDILLQRERPGGRLLLLDEKGHAGRPIMLTEFGGIALASQEQESWGYSSADNQAAFAQKFKKLMRVVRSLPMLSGFCYTQLTDTYQEANGLLYADRTPKIPLAEIDAATRGERPAQEMQREFEWRERLMQFQAQHHHVESRDYRLHDAR